MQHPLPSAGDVRGVGSIPGQEDALEKGMATHSGILAWRILWTKEPSGLQSKVTKSKTQLKCLSTHIYKVQVYLKRKVKHISMPDV